MAQKESQTLIHGQIWEEYPRNRKRKSAWRKVSLDAEKTGYTAIMSHFTSEHPMYVFSIEIQAQSGGTPC